MKDPGYLLDPDDAEEMARLRLLGKAITFSIGSHFPALPKEQLPHIRDVLDVGCGPGEWAIGVAQTYGHMTVTGIDKSTIMVPFANMEAESLGVPACFRVMDATKPLDFASNSFDVVNARFIVGFMHRDAWPSLLTECKRVLRPGGWICLTEGDAYVMRSDAIVQIYLIMTEIMWRFGYSFVPRGGTFCLTPHLKPLLAGSGYTHINRTTSLVDFSAGEPAYESLLQNTLHFLEEFKTVVVEKAKALPEEEYEAFRVQATHDIQQPDYRGLWYLLNIVGQKP